MATEGKPKPGPDLIENLDFQVHLVCYLYGWRLADVHAMSVGQLKKAARYGMRIHAMMKLYDIKAGIAADPWYGPQDRARLEREFIDMAEGDERTEQQRIDEAWKRMRRARGKE